MITLAKIGSIPFKMHRQVPEHINGVILKHVDNRWYVSFQAEVLSAPVANVTEDTKIVGIDVGVKSFIRDSDRRDVENPKFLSGKLDRLRFLQRELSRKEKGSNNRSKARNLVARLHEKIRNIRDNKNHQESHRYANMYDIIVVEKLDIMGMVNRQHKIAKLSPTARRTLRRNILDAAWGDFIRKLEYKAEGAGKRVIKVDPKITTQRCSRCGQLVLKDITNRTHSCPYCGLEIDRDYNSALNILDEGIKIIRVGNLPQIVEGGVHTMQGHGKHLPVKQEASGLFRFVRNSGNIA